MCWSDELSQRLSVAVLHADMLNGRLHISRLLVKHLSRLREDEQLIIICLLSPPWTSPENVTDYKKNFLGQDVTDFMGKLINACPSLCATQLCLIDICLVLNNS